jgi:hypothetical protein
MPQASQEQNKRRAFQLSTDWWAVLTALALAVLVRLGLIHKVPW